MPVRFVALVLLVLVAACGSKSKLSADEYYKQASEAFAKKNYEAAVNQYKDLLDQYPFDNHAEEAELRIAESHYKNKHYPEAIAAFNDFQRMHPMSPELPKVYYLLGKSYMDQMTTTDRDQGAAENAHGWFRVVIDRYPESPYAGKSRRKLAQCRNALAEHELYIATYYFKRKNRRAGENRVKGILENYSDTPVATRALEQLADAYARAGDHEHERLARAALAERGDATVAASGPKIDLAQAADGATLTDVTLTTDATPSAGLAAAASSGPATATLLADLTRRFGPGQGVSTATTSPSLLDPVPTKPKTSGDPRYGPSGGPGSGPD
jgi:outer membrane protein assembly factor BamD